MRPRRRRLAARAILTPLSALALGACDPTPQPAPPPASPPPAGSPPASSPAAPGAPGASAPAKPAPSAPAAAPETIPVTIGGKKFMLELAASDPVRIKGLGGRTSIAPDGGMLFSFPGSFQLSFVMRDCVIPIDIAFLDASGRVLALHTMQPEAPRAENESAADYEARLKKYDSRFPAMFAVEVAGGALDKLGVKTGDLMRFDAEGVKRRTR